MMKDIAKVDGNETFVGTGFHPFQCKQVRKFMAIVSTLVYLFDNAIPLDRMKLPGLPKYW